MTTPTNPMGLEQRDLLVSLNTTIKSLDEKFKGLDDKLDAFRREQKEFEQRLEDKFVGKTEHLMLDGKVNSLDDKIDALSKKLKEEFVTKVDVEPMLQAYNYGASTLRKWIVISLLVVSVLGVALWIGNQVMTGVENMMTAQAKIMQEIKSKTN